MLIGLSVVAMLVTPFIAVGLVSKLLGFEALAGVGAFLFFMLVCGLLFIIGLVFDPKIKWRLWL